jgi:hypothetical protein
MQERFRQDAGATKKVRTTRTKESAHLWKTKVGHRETEGEFGRKTATLKAKGAAPTREGCRQDAGATKTFGASKAMAVANFRSKFGSPEERNRLAQFYASLTEGELQQLAREGTSLTEEARAALALEMSKRGMAVDSSDLARDAEDSPAERGRPEMRDLLTIRQFRDLPEALLAKSALESAGIECFLGDDNLIRMDWLWSNLLGGIKLRVRQEDAIVASRLLEGGGASETDAENSNK